MSRSNILNVKLSPLETKNVKVMIADDHPFYLDGLKAVLHEVPFIKHIKEARTGKEVLDFLSKKDYNLLFLDIDMPDMTGLEALRKIRITNKNLRVIMLSMFCSQSQVMQAYELKANGYLLKEVGMEELERCIGEVLKGNSYYCDKAVDEVMLAMKKRFDQSTALQYEFKGTELSPREIDVLKLLCRQYSNKEVASMLKITEYTVKGHRDNIKKKIDVQNLAGMVEYAIKHGFHIMA